MASCATKMTPPAAPCPLEVEPMILRFVRLIDRAFIRTSPPLPVELGRTTELIKLLLSSTNSPTTFRRMSPELRSLIFDIKLWLDS